MQPLSTSKLLEVWEQGTTESPTLRALSLLRAAYLDASPESLAALSVGRRDACLLTLRTWTFGSRCDCLALCPDCGEQIQLDFDIANILLKDHPEIDEMFSLTLENYNVSFRLPNSLDLIAIPKDCDRALARQILLKRCLVDIEGGTGMLEELSESMLTAIEGYMAQLDPQADVRLDLCCPACSYRWLAGFDIVLYFWDEIHSWAGRILKEVHLLASAYGWCEQDILNLSPLRRRLYLEMAGT
jgi:hypothetical protein